PIRRSLKLGALPVYLLLLESKISMAGVFPYRARRYLCPESYRACPTPAARRVASSTPRPAQQSASVPLITTAGTLRIPKLFACRATSGLCISNTVTSHEGHAIRLTSSTVSSQAAHPALKISIVRLVAIVVSFQRCTFPSVSSDARMGQAVISPCPEHASTSFASA